MESKNEPVKFKIVTIILGIATFLIGVKMLTFNTHGEDQKIGTITILIGFAVFALGIDKLNSKSNISLKKREKREKRKRKRKTR